MRFGVRAEHARRKQRAVGIRLKVHFTIVFIRLYFIFYDRIACILPRYGVKTFQAVARFFKLWLGGCQPTASDGFSFRLCHNTHTLARTRVTTHTLARAVQAGAIRVGQLKHPPLLFITLFNTKTNCKYKNLLQKYIYFKKTLLRWVLSASDDFNIRLWRARASEGVKPLLPREQARNAPIRSWKRIASFFYTSTQVFAA